MIYTFYSFKGGVGRSMALANIAEVLYRQGLNVLIVDFDLEAPGLERYFEVDGAQHSPDIVVSKRGVMDLLVSYKNLRSLPVLSLPNSAPTTTETEASAAHDEFPFPVEPLSNFIVPIYEKETRSRAASKTGSLKRRGSLSIIPAGRRDGEEFARYAERVRGFGWDDFFANWDGELFFDWFRKEASEAADVVLIDSRTGVTEMSGVCTYQLADVVVMFVAPNHQNLNGIQMMATSLANPQLIEEGRRGRPLAQLFVPSRVESGEGKKLNAFAERYNQVLGRMLPTSLKFESGAFIDLKIPYLPYYAFIEDVAVRESDRPAAADMVKAFEKITTFLAQLAPPSSEIYRLYQTDENNRVIPIEQLIKIAEDFYARFLPDEREVIQRAFVRLVRLAQPGDGTGDVRLSVNLKDFDRETQRIVRSLADSHLVTIEPGRQPGDEVAQLADEALITKWERLEDWLSEDRDFLLWRQQIRANIAEWETHKRRRDRLLKGSRLKAARQWEQTRLNDLNVSEVFYINKSEQDQKLRWRTIALVVLILSLLAAYPINKAYKSYKNARQDEQQKAQQQRETDAAKAFEAGNSALRDAHNPEKAADREDNYNKAIAFYTQAINLNSNYADAYFKRGSVFLGQGTYGQAIDDFSKVLSLTPASTAAYLNRGIARMNNGDNDNAIADYNRAIELNPVSAEFYLNRGIAFMNKGDADHAIIDYSKAIQLAPNSAEAYFYRGNAYETKAQTDNALADYDQSLNLNPDYAEAHYARGNYYLKKGDAKSTDNAIADYSAALKGMPQNAKVHYSLGNAYIKKGDKKNAAAYLKSALTYSQDKNLNVEIGQKLLELGISNVSSARVFISLEYNDTKDFDTVSNVGIALRNKGYNIKDTKIANGETYGDVRFFSSDDQQTAEKIAQAVRDRLAKDGIFLSMQCNYYGKLYPNVRPGSFEVWFPSLPEGKKTQSAEPKLKARRR
ncbi:MAG TPA: tetratricopeptide repeat protein [Pyrinomonadaceae bacterium]|jgi:tetratricopeptide (TPR) repeat protein